ncbi:hypothetical protein QBC36DRAFT_309359 [Triangularia setosa]|uniref:RlpA-like protein double-psi beta-barrel domain-containing protein n=1 Tax=Triangularia setosa TaxID=2587417 RepID=A0AAN6WAJ2_9PEZI|nr:hypothetical protein QBC36DRAFT_309359 [Podospora setosa]
MVLPTLTLRALLTLSTLALPILSLPAPIPKPFSSIVIKRGATHRSSEVDSTWDDAENWEPHSGWYFYNDDSADWNDDDHDDEEDWDVDSWDDDYDYDNDNDNDYEDYNDCDEEWDEEWDEDDDDGEEEEEEGEWDGGDNDDEGNWENGDDSDKDGQIRYFENDWEGDDDQSSYDYSSSPASESVMYPPPQTLHSGIGTVYTQDGHAGSCGNHHDDTAFVAALGNAWMHSQYRASECGRQIQVTNKGSHYHIGGEGNTITVTVQDTCASCDEGHVDFSLAAWDALTDGSPHGQVDLEW